jgi:nucleoside-diphosphate-sugar epimerase
MTSAKILFIGGTGIISSACAARAIERGLDLTVLNRGANALRPLPDAVRVLHADARDRAAMQAALGDAEFDAVVDFIAFTPEHVQADIDTFRGRTGQYVFISSASAYQTPPAHLPITESTPLRNPEWEYSRNKIACEQLLVDAYREHGFPATIVRPSHTYDRTSLPTMGGWTDIARMRRGAPVVVHGDGSSLWTLTHHRDFAVAFVGLLANPAAVGDSFHITSDELLTWNQIYTAVGRAAGVEPTLVHATSEAIATIAPKLGPGLLGDKTHSVIFDNSKVKRLVTEYTATVPYVDGARESIAWFDAHPDRQVVDPDLDAVFDKLVAATGHV